MTDELRKAIEESRREHEEASVQDEKKAFLDAIETKYHLCAASAEGLLDYGKLSAEMSYGGEVDLDDEVFKDWSRAAIERLKKNDKIRHVLDLDAMEQIKEDPRMLIGNMATSIMEFLGDMISERLMLELAARTAGPEVFQEMLDDIRKGPSIRIRKVRLKDDKDGLNEIIGEILKDIQKDIKKAREEEKLDEDEE